MTIHTSSLPQSRYTRHEVTGNQAANVDHSLFRYTRVSKGNYISKRNYVSKLLLGTGLIAAAAATVAGGLALAQGATTITIATVNNPDMVTMQKLTPEFEKLNPGIKLNWVVLPENDLRQRVTTDIATKAGSFDVLTIGTYETPIWGKQGWLTEMSDLPASYDLADILKPVRAGLSSGGKLYALPFYAESSMLMYRKDLFAAAKIRISQTPTWTQVAAAAKKLHRASTASACADCRAGARTWPS